MNKAKIVGFVQFEKKAEAPVVVKKSYVQRPLKVRFAPLLAEAFKRKSLSV